MSSRTTVCVIGLGYIGLPTAALLASEGYDVVGVDINQSTVDIINRAEIHITEPGLDAFVRSAVTSNRLRAYTEPQPADVYMICVPTPFVAGDGDVPQPNLEHVLAATRSLAAVVRPGNIVILESTSPVGTTEKVRDLLRQSGVDTDRLYLAYCPERVLPGRIMFELVQEARIIGGINPLSTQVVGDFYRSFVKGTVLGTDCKTAEMTKLVENSYRDVNIAFANELSMLCEPLGIDVTELISLANHHPRVNILQPGCGVGGHCIAVDPWFIISQDADNARLIRTAREVNTYKAEWVVEKIKSCALEFQLNNGRVPLIACMGLAFKPDIDDLRESPALYITQALQQKRFNVVAVEPNIDGYEGLRLMDTTDALAQADLVVFLVRHREFQGLNVEGRQVLDFSSVLPHNKVHVASETPATFTADSMGGALGNESAAMFSPHAPLPWAALSRHAPLGDGAAAL